MDPRLQKALEFLRKYGPIVRELGPYLIEIPGYLSIARQAYALAKELAERLRSAEGLTDADRAEIVAILAQDPRTIGLEGGL